MLSAALDLLQLVAQLALLQLILVGAQVFKRLILLEGRDESSELVHECRCAMLEEVIDGHQHIEILASLI